MASDKRQAAIGKGLQAMQALYDFGNALLAINGRQITKAEWQAVLAGQACSTQLQRSLELLLDLDGAPADGKAARI